MNQYQNQPQVFSFSVNGCTFRVRNNSTVYSLPDRSLTKMHRHHIAEIHYIYGGGETLIFLDSEAHREETLTVEAGQLLLIPPQIFHSTVANGRLLRFSFTFEISGASHFSEYLTGAICKVKSPMIFFNAHFRDAFSVICENIESNNIFFNQYHRQLLTISVMTALIDILFRDLPQAESPISPLRDSDREFLIRDFFNRTAIDGDSLGILANLLHLSTRQVQTVVKRLTGKSFKSLILDSKMQLAKAMVQCSNRTLISIALEIGYDSYSSFYTAYKKHHGVTPMEHRITASGSRPNPV